MAVLWLWSTIKKRPLPRKIGIGVAIFFLVGAFFQAWRDQYRSTNAMHKKLAELTTPVLRGEIGHVSFGLGGKNNQDVIMIVELKIKNTGAPTAIDSPLALVRLHSGRVVRMENLDPPKKEIITKDIQGGTMSFPTTAYLPFAGTKPIPTGGILAGFVFGRLRDVALNEVHELPLVVGLEFADAYGNPHKLTRQLTSIK